MADLTDLLREYDAEGLHVLRDEATGLRGFIAVHDTTLGPAAGGTRRYPFDSDTEAVRTALELAQAMTYKYALAGIDMGGGKGVIWVEDEDVGDEALYRAYAREIEALDGLFTTGGDVGTHERELRWMKAETDYVAGLPEQFDHPDDEFYHPGALGVREAMAACVDVADDDRELGDCHVAVQGVGEMGAALVRYLDEAGAQVTVADPDSAAVDAVVDEFGATAVDPEDVYGVDCDVFAPAALGGVIDEGTIPELQCDVVCGAANNQLATPEDGRRLHERGILYAPDYLANAGTVIDYTDLMRSGGYHYDRARAKLATIGEQTREIARRSLAEDRPTSAVADELAEERLDALGSLREVRRNDPVGG
jgi:leucine dehydrogenase